MPISVGKISQQALDQDSTVQPGSDQGTPRSPSIPSTSDILSYQPRDEPLPGMRIIARLWCHEMSRVFGDRILDQHGEEWREVME